MNLIEELQEHRAKSTKRSYYPERLRRAVAAHFEREFASGRARMEIAAELGVHVSTIDLWRKQLRPKRAFVPVRIEAATSSTIVVHAGDVRVEGLGVTELAALLKALRC